MVTVALLSNPRSTGNRAILPQVRSFCAEHADVFHYEVEEVGQIGEAFRTIAMVKPRVIAINGGDGTVQAALTELHNGNYFGDTPPPIAVLPNGKTNLIALDLGSQGDPLVALERVVAIARADLDRHVIERRLISLRDGDDDTRPVLGMFLGGAGLADTMLYCRDRIYPLGLPNGLSHGIAVMAAVFSIMFAARFLPARPRPVRVSVLREGQLQGKFSVLIVTTLEKILFNVRTMDSSNRRMRLLAVDGNMGAVMRLIYASLRGVLGRKPMGGIHFESGDEIRIEGEKTNIILDGELFQVRHDHPITLTSTAPKPFLRLAA